MGFALSRPGPYYVPSWFLEIGLISGIETNVILNETDAALFETWQREKKHISSRIGYIFNAFEHDAFKKWCTGESSLAVTSNTSDVHLLAPGCGHVLHSVNKDSFRCPYCEVKMCLDFQELLASTMERARQEAIDMTHRRRKKESALEWMDDARQGWLYARLILTHAVLHHEKLAELEAQSLHSNDPMWPEGVSQQWCIHTSA